MRPIHSQLHCQHKEPKKGHYVKFRVNFQMELSKYTHTPTHTLPHTKRKKLSLLHLLYPKHSNCKMCALTRGVNLSYDMVSISQKFWIFNILHWFIGKVIKKREIKERTNSCCERTWVLKVSYSYLKLVKTKSASTAIFEIFLFFFLNIYW